MRTTVLRLCGQPEAGPTGVADQSNDATSYALGLKFLLLAAILYAPGTALYFWARREQGQRVFTPAEWGLFLVAVVGAVLGVVFLATGYITL